MTRSYTYSRVFSRLPASSRVFSRILTYSHVFSRILTYSRVFSRILAYSYVFSRILAYSHVFSGILALSSVHSDVFIVLIRLLYYLRLSELLEEQLGFSVENGKVVIFGIKNEELYFHSCYLNKVLTTCALGVSSCFCASLLFNQHFCSSLLSIVKVLLME